MQLTYPRQRPDTEAAPELAISGSAKLLLTVTEAAARLGVGRTLMYELISTGAVASVQVGRLRRIRPVDLEVYAMSLAPATTPVPSAA